MKKRACLLGAAAMAVAVLQAQNPLIHDQFTADPTARSFGGRVYLYPSHDIPSPVEHLQDWFCMADYHVFSSDNLTDWTDHGMILSQETVPWVRPGSYAMWAPDCVERDGRYYFFFPAAPKSMERGFAIGVAEADDPAGPFTPHAEPIKGVMGIDPCVLVDDDGAAYIYWSGMGIRCARLSDDMSSIVGEPVLCQGLPEGFKEGPFAFKKDGIYYLTFPWVRDVTETLAYATADNPFGPFTFRGLIMEEHPSGCWTNHHSILNHRGEWYLFYHHNDYSPQIDKRRSARADVITFNADGSINTVKPTLRGVGVTDARGRVQVDRCSDRSSVATDVVFNDPDRPFDGWSVKFGAPGSWVRYDRVDFGSEPLTTVTAAVKGGDDSELLVSLDNPSKKLAEITPDGSGSARAQVLIDSVSGVHDIYVTLMKGSDVLLDWLSFGTPAEAGAPQLERAGTDGTYFTAPAAEASAPDADGFIRRWWILDPINKPNRSNTVFTDSYLRDAFSVEYYPGQTTAVPRKGDKVKVDGEKLQWHELESTGYNVHLYRFASQRQKQVYGVLFHFVTVIDCPEEIADVRLSAGSNSASMWWLNGEEVLLLSGDRRMVSDDGRSDRITLKKGRNVLHGAVINGPGMSGFCVRFLDADGKPVTGYKLRGN